MKRSVGSKTPFKDELAFFQQINSNTNKGPDKAARKAGHGSDAKVEAAEVDRLQSTTAAPFASSSAVLASKQDADATKRVGPAPPERCIASEARQLGFDPSFFEDLPRDMALEILDETRREEGNHNEGGSSSNSGNNVASRPLSAAAESSPAGFPPTGDRPAVNGEEAEALLLRDPQRREASAKPPSQHDRGGRCNSQQGQDPQDTEHPVIESLPSRQQEPRHGELTLQSIVELRDTMTTAMSLSSSGPVDYASTSFLRQQELQGDEDDALVRHTFALPRAVFGSHQEPPKMMGETIRHLMERDEMRLAELRRLCGLGMARTFP